MAIKNPTLYYKKYKVTPSVEYLPCLPTKDCPITRIPKNSEVVFISKIDEDLYEVDFVDPDILHDQPKRVKIGALGLDHMLPIYRRNA